MKEGFKELTNGWTFYWEGTVALYGRCDRATFEGSLAGFREAQDRGEDYFFDFTTVMVDGEEVNLYETGSLSPDEQYSIHEIREGLVEDGEPMSDDELIEEFLSGIS